MSDIDPTVQGFIEQANTAEARGLHSERAAAATAGLAAMAAAYNPAPSATPTNSVEAGKRLVVSQQRRKLAQSGFQR